MIPSELPFQPDPSALKLSDFHSCRPRQIGSWLEENCTAICDVVFDRIRTTMSQPCSRPEISEADQTYAPDVIGTYFSDPALQTANPITQLMIYCATRYTGVNCHQFVFSEPKSVELAGRPLHFIEYAERLSPNRLTELLDILSNDIPEISNPVFIVRDRCQELSARNGLQLSPFLSNLYSASANYNSTIARNLNNEICATITRFGKREFTASAAFFWLVLMIAIVHDVSIDYLLLRDYSRFATIHGGNLTDHQQMLLSAFLLASDDARKDAIQHLLLWEC